MTTARTPQHRDRDVAGCLVERERRDASLSDARSERLARERMSLSRFRTPRSIRLAREPMSSSQIEFAQRFGVRFDTVTGWRR
jgi:DNA-binding transcriptional regulator YiaG